jgi:class 3 adenylate cyclase/tetratricopeptide (TPR) repeat protein
MARLREGTYHRDVVGGSADGAGRATAIVLFTDLVGSTELRSRLGEEAAEALRRRHDGLVTGAIETNRGRLVKNLGDGVMATFTGASDALAAAVGIQQALDRHHRSDASAVPLEVRIGISAGDVAFEEADCFGTPVIEAARLCAAAAGGQILVTEVVRLLAGTGGGYELRPVGPLDLKGLPAPVSACEVAWEPLRVPSVPMPALLTDIGRVFVGRDRELERLQQLWKEAAAGELRVALLAGEPGVGKTRLAAELAGRVHDEGGVVLAGRCDEYLGVPYQPVVEVLRHFVDHTPAEDLAHGLGRYMGELVRLVPELPERVTDLPPPLRSDPETERYRLFDAVAAWLGAVAAETPVLLVLDDLQWGAKPTLLLLRHVVRSAEPKRILVLGTYRDTELGHDHPLVEILADLRRQASVERLSLVGLDSSGVAAFMEQAGGHALDDGDLLLARAIHAETEGNPFFVREVLRHLAETGVVEQRDGRWATRLPVEELGIPESVREVVGRRLSHLSKEANRVLLMAAVVGAEFELSILQVVEVLSEGDLLSTMEEATEARLILEVAGLAGRYRFAHALVRDSLYDGLSAARRVTLHRRVAEAIEAVHATQLDDHLPALAHHYARASTPATVTSKAVDYTARAGDRALAQFANDEAVTYYRSVLELLDVAERPRDEGRRLELLISLGEALRRAGDPAHREVLLEAAGLAMGRGDADALARAALANSRVTIFSSAGAVDSERVVVLESALAAVGPADSATRARLLAILSLELTFSGDWERRVGLSSEALAMAYRLGDPGTLAHVLLTRYNSVLAPSTLGERHDESAELVSLAERLGDPATACRAAWCRYRTAMEMADVDEADRYLEVVDQLTAELGQPGLRWIATWSRAGRLLYAGGIDEAERLIGEGLGLGRTAGEVDAPVFFAAQHSLVRFEQGRLGELEDLLTEAAAGTPGYPLFPALLAQLYCELGRDDEARSWFEHLAGPGFSALARHVIGLRTMATCAVVACHLGDRARATELHDQLAPYPDQLPIAGGVALGAVAYHLGMLASTVDDFNEAESRFSAAAALHERTRAPTWLARTRLEWARMLLVRRQPGDAERARDLLGQALAAARELGLGNVERGAVGLLT